MLLQAVLLWCATAAILLLLAALLLSRLGTGSSVIGYVSSSISFLSALAAGVCVGREGKQGAMARALVTSGALILLLLTIGVLIAGMETDASGVLSVVTFTISGVLLGAALASGGKRGKRPKAFARTRPVRR
ncbi:MAG: hypothetical protein IK095_07760 [Oscillospiraceae bacterium]|nr:hypothetical protein [Oscillospiraceae bacterium]